MQNLREINISQLIERIIFNRYSNRDIVNFIHLCSAHAYGFLKIKYYRNKLFFGVNCSSDEMLQDLAVDLIAPLFARDKNGRFSVLKKYFQPLLEEIEGNNETILIFLKRLIVSKAKQELVEKFKKEDPVGWKIYRNLQLVPTRNERIGVFQFGTDPYFYWKTSDSRIRIPEDLMPALPEISYEDLIDQVHRAVSHNKTTPLIVEAILLQLKHDPRYRQFISQKKMFKCLNKVLRIEIISLIEEKEWKATNNISLNNEELHHVYQSVSQEICIQINKVYVVKGKINNRESEKYSTILKQYFEDLIFRGNAQRIPEYMNHNPDYRFITKNWKTHQSRLEYLIKLGKKHLKEIIIP